jgi:hypothetical protein
VSNASKPPPSNGGGQPGNSGIPKSQHARLRAGQGRPTGQVVNDVQGAGPKDVFVQLDDGRFVVRGGFGREHIIEADGEHVTSVRRSDAAHQARLRNRVIRPATDEEFQRLKGFVV